MPRPFAPSRLYVPPLVYAGEREQLLADLVIVEGQIRRNAPGSIYRPALERHRIRLKARLLAIGAPTAPVPGLDRKDLQ